MLDFATAIDDIERDFRRLIETGPFPITKRPSPVPKELPGVYVLYESNRALYVGRGRNVRQRLANHRSGSVSAASLTVKLARIAAKKPSKYTSATKAENLLKTDPIFAAAFQKARERILAMHVRYVDTKYDDDDVRQALLEIYAATKLGTLARCGGFNTFKTS